MKKTIAIAAGTSTLAGLAYAIDPDLFVRYLSDTAANKIAQFGFLFTLAAWIHSGRVKKEIKENFSIFSAAAEIHAKSLTDAINNVASALTQDLKIQSHRLAQVESKVDDLHSRIETLEKPNKGALQ